LCVRVKDEVKQSWTRSEGTEEWKPNTFPFCVLRRESPYFEILIEDR